jgi:hypothetical protein
VHLRRPIQSCHRSLGSTNVRGDVF